MRDPGAVARAGETVAWPSLEGFQQESHRQETLDVYREAREVLSRRLASP